MFVGLVSKAQTIFREIAPFFFLNAMFVVPISVFCFGSRVYSGERLVAVQVESNAPTVSLKTSES